MIIVIFIFLMAATGGIFADGTPKPNNSFLQGNKKNPSAGLNTASSPALVDKDSLGQSSIDDLLLRKQEEDKKRRAYELDKARQAVRHSLDIRRAQLEEMRQNQAEFDALDKEEREVVIKALLKKEMQKSAIEAAVEQYENEQEKDKNKLKEEELVKSTLTMNDFVGTVPEGVQQAINFFSKPDVRKAYERFNIAPARGILMYGPTGTGKTMLAACMAGELEVPFIVARPRDINSMYEGGVQENINHMFARAREAAKKSPNKKAILFFDEIDSLAMARNNNLHSNTHHHVVGVVNTLLQNMDGFDKEDTSVIVIGATNNLRVMDEAVLRRFPYRIAFKNPEELARQEVVMHTLKKMPVEADKAHEIAVSIACRTEGASNAHLVDFIHQVARRAAGENAECLTVALVLKELDRQYPLKNQNPGLLLWLGRKIFGQSSSLNIKKSH